jgi:hypothetical protein
MVTLLRITRNNPFSEVGLSIGELLGLWWFDRDKYNSLWVNRPTWLPVGCTTLRWENPVIFQLCYQGSAWQTTSLQAMREISRRDCKIWRMFLPRFGDENWHDHHPRNMDRWSMIVCWERHESIHVYICYREILIFTHATFTYKSYN